MFPTWPTLRMRISLVWTSLNFLVFMLALIPVLISQVIKEIFRNSGKSEKKEIPRKVLPFFRKLSTGMNRSIWIRPRITENSIQMVSAPHCSWLPKEPLFFLMKTTCIFNSLKTRLTRCLRCISGHFLLVKTVLLKTTLFKKNVERKSLNNHFI